MKRLFTLITAICLCIMLFGCTQTKSPAQIAATTLPVWEFTTILCEGTGITVTRVITESVSCLHDYTLQVSQMRAIEAAEAVVISGAGLEDFLGSDLLAGRNIVDASTGVALLCTGEDQKEGHDRESDPHIWLSIENARQMAHNICTGLLNLYPRQEKVMKENLAALDAEFDALTAYASSQLSNLACRQMVTFHDGFGYMAEAFDLEIIHAIEEESGSEASARELIELTGIVRDHGLNAIFTERYGSVSAASVVAAETGVQVYSLDMAMGGNSYFDAMYHNIDVLKEALA